MAARDSALAAAAAARAALEVELMISRKVHVYV